MSARLLLIALALTRPAAAQVAPDPGSSERGTLGYSRLEAAVPLRPGTMALSLDASLMRASNFLIVGGSHSGNTERIVLAFSPLAGLDVAVAWRRSSQNNSAYIYQRLEHAGDPQLAVKYARPIGPEVSVAAGTFVRWPTVWPRQSIELTAATFGLYGAATYEVTPELPLSLNLGVVLDNSLAAAPAGSDAFQRYSSGVGDGRAVLVGLGGSRRIVLKDGFASIAPMAETVALLALGGERFSDNPLTATLGAKLFLGPRQRFELRSALDLRVLGAPSPASPFPGQPPWAFGIALTGRFDAYGDLTCATSAQCAGEYSCNAGVCELPPPPPVVATAGGPAPPKGFVLMGEVVDADTGAGIPQAIIKMSGFDTGLVTDPGGRFTSWFIPKSDGMLKLTIEAAGYQATAQVLSRNLESNPPSLRVTLVPFGADVPARLRGNIKDASTGKPVRARVIIPSLPKREQNLDVDVKGQLEAQLKAGRYAITISHPGYETQVKQMQLRPGETVILNIDLVRR